jgi:hypothetical protein
MKSADSYLGKRKGGKSVLLRLWERLRLKPVLDLINSEKTKPSDVRWARDVLLAGKVDVTGEFIDIEVGYTYSKKVNFGRWYASWPSLQTCSGYIRRLCSVGIYADVDIKNCFPVILLQIAKKNSILTPCLEEYVINREAWANKICIELSITFKQVKTAVLIVIHGGNYKRATEKKPNATLEAFAQELQNVGEQLRVLPEYKQQWADAERAQKEKKLGYTTQWALSFPIFARSKKRPSSAT